MQLNKVDLQSEISRIFQAKVGDFKRVLTYIKEQI